MKIHRNYKHKIFFTSDTHFFHDGIIKYCNRPFKDSKEMNEQLIANWNAVVRPEDVVYHLGDFAMGKCTKKEIAETVMALNGKIILIIGNHDHHAVLPAHHKYNLFAETHTDLDIRIFTNEEGPDDYIDIHLAHFPKLVWNRKHYGAWHAFGHCHSTKPIVHQDFSQHDCGVDGNNYTPMLFKEFGSIITTRHLEGWES